VLLKPEDFSAEAERVLAQKLALVRPLLAEKQRAKIDEAKQRLRDKLYQRLGWQPRCKPPSSQRPDPAAALHRHVLDLHNGRER